MPSDEVSKSDHNPHWDQLAACGQFDRLAGEIELWRNNFCVSLSQWIQLAPAPWSDTVEPLIKNLQRLEPGELACDWSEWRDHLCDLNKDGHLLREDYLQHIGPTPLCCLNSVLLQVDRLASFPDQIGMIGATLFADLKVFECWAAEHGIYGDDYDRLRLWIENLALGLLSRQYPPPQQARQHLMGLWKSVRDEHARQAADTALGSPTQSNRWNSWILLLELCEHETQDHTPVLNSLDALDADVEDVGSTLADHSEVADLVADYREVCAQLRQALLKGKRLKGWSKILSPILIDLDRFVPREDQPGVPVSRVRSLCQEFEAGALSTEQFQQELTRFAATLVESRNQSRIQAAQHPGEVAFLDALGKLQGGLDILTAVERAGQASRLEMGCTLIEDGLAQIQQLEAGGG